MCSGLNVFVGFLNRAWPSSGAAVSHHNPEESYNSIKVEPNHPINLTHTMSWQGQQHHTSITDRAPADPSFPLSQLVSRSFTPTLLPPARIKLTLVPLSGQTLTPTSSEPAPSRALPFSASRVESGQPRQATTYVRPPILPRLHSLGLTSLQSPVLAVVSGGAGCVDCHSQ